MNKMPRIVRLQTPAIRHIETSSNAPPILPINSAGTHQYLNVPVRPKLSSDLVNGWTQGALLAEPLGLYDTLDGTYDAQGSLQLQTNALLRGGQVHAPYSGTHGTHFSSDNATISVANSGGTYYNGALTRKPHFRTASGATLTVLEAGMDACEGTTSISYSAATGEFTIPAGIYLAHVHLAISDVASGTVVSSYISNVESSVSNPDLTRYGTSQGRVNIFGYLRYSTLLYIDESTRHSGKVRVFVTHDNSTDATVAANDIMFHRLVDLAGTRQDP